MFILWSENSPNAKFCSEYNEPLDTTVAESSDEKLKKQDELTKTVFRKLIEKAPEVLKEFLQEDDISQEFQRLGKAKSTA